MRFVPQRILHGLLAGRYLPIWAYVVFIGALVSEILSLVVYHGVLQCDRRGSPYL